MKAESANAEVTVEEEDGGEEPSASYPASSDTSHTPSPAPSSPARPSTPIRVPPQAIIHPSLLRPNGGAPDHPLFAIEQLGIDRRLIVNRKRQLKMYRVWMQGKFRKL